MTNTYLKKIYNKVFEEVKINPQIKGLERGVLYNVIAIILGEENLYAAQDICHSLNIKSSAEGDDEIIKELITEVFIDRQVLSQNIPGKDWVVKSSLKGNQAFKNEEEKMEWVIVAACALVGVYFCNQYLKKIQQQKANQKKGIAAESKPAPLPIPAALCLNVPASVVSNLKVDARVSFDKLPYLIDNASYFLCTRIEDAISNEKRLERLLDQNIASDSRRDVYIRININDGQQLIDNKIRYKLKENLPIHAEYVVKEKVCLRNLSGLEEFNRI